MRRMWCLLLLATTIPAHADTSVLPGLWEKTETVTVDGTKVPSEPRSVCLKAGEASLERLLLINDDEAKARGCKSEITRPGEGRMPTTLQKLGGLRSEPPISLPSASGTMPQATATAPPPVLPPHVLLRS